VLLLLQELKGNGKDQLACIGDPKCYSMLSVDILLIINRLKACAEQFVCTTLFAKEQLEQRCETADREVCHNDMCDMVPHCLGCKEWQVLYSIADHLHLYKACCLIKFILQHVTCVCACA